MAASPYKDSGSTRRRQSHGKAHPVSHLVLHRGDVRRNAAARPLDPQPAGRTAALQPLRTIARRRRDRKRHHPRRLLHRYPAHAHRRTQRVHHHPGRAGSGASALGPGRGIPPGGREHLAAQSAVLGHPGAAVLRPVAVPAAQAGRETGRTGRVHDHRQEQGQDLRRGRYQDHLRRCRRGRRGQGRVAGAGGIPQGPAGLRLAGRAHAQGRAAGRPARHRQDLDRPRRGRRGRGAVLLDQRVGIRRDVRRR